MVRPTYQAQKEFTFVSQAFPPDKFLVARFTGVEGVSRLYEFDITLAAEDPEIDIRSALQNSATFKIIAGDNEIAFHGILARFEQLQEIDETVFYRAVLVPRLWQTSLYHENQLFLDKNVPDIIQEVLNQAGLTSNDYDLRLTGTYDPWEYICQFRETDFNFLSRWMEREGIYYYFEQTDNGDKLIITDSSTSHEDVSGETAIPYLPPSGQVPAEEDCVHNFTCRHQMLPMKVMLKDYNYRRPTLDLKGEAEIDPDGGRGTVYIYGEHFKTPEQGNALARIRAEEFLCRERLFYGESTAPNLCPGFLFELTDHYRDSYNQRYLITELTHAGKSARFLFEGESSAGSGTESRMGYTNQFTLIPGDIQFRPSREASKTRFYGSMNATIDAEGDGQYAEIDDQGRYKVILPFDQSGNSGGKASRWIRMAQPYAGANYGMHFPLHRGTEVLLTFVDGDPDRPIIAGSVPNPDTMTPVTGDNQTQSMIRTGGGNQMAIEDNKGSQFISLISSALGSYFRIGQPNSDGPPGHSMGTDGDSKTKVGGNEKKSVDGNSNTTIKQGCEIEIHKDSKKIVHGNTTEKTIGDKVSYTKGNTNETFIGNKTSFMKGNTDEHYVGSKTSTVDASTEEKFVGTKISSCLAATDEKFYGAKNTFCAAATNENFVGIKTSVCGGLSVSRSAVKNILIAPENEIKAGKVIKLVCGSSSIEISPYEIKIKSLTVDVDSFTNFEDDVKFKKSIEVDGDCNLDGEYSNPSFRSK